jgi:hypothetical protein
MLITRLHRCACLLAIATVLGLLISMAEPPAYGQATTSAGTIQGTITDPSGAVIPSATVTITNKANGSVVKVTTSSSGYYTSGPLVSGSYTISVSHAGFAPIQAGATVQIGNVTNGNLALSLGSTTTVLEVQASDVRVDTQQSEVQGVLTSAQIENLPINGRNFLDLAQLEPGVQLQDGQDFDPTKAGYTSVSFNGIYGRNARLSLDGQDISDETVGTTVLNVTQGSIEEFQVGRSSLDLSNEITASGSVIVSTKSGTNQFHGMAFYDFRDERAGFANQPGGVGLPFQRNQFGGAFGGPLLHDKLFFFGSSERIKQDAFAPVELGGAFASLSGGYGQTFRDTYSAARLDWNAPHGIHTFFRLAYEVNGAASTFGLGFARYVNRDNTPGFVGGADFVTGKLTHSFRISYLKFHNFIADDSAGTYEPLPGALVRGNGGLYAGPNYLAPQATYQGAKQERYDGGWNIGLHSIRFGLSLNDINGGGYAKFFGLSPYLRLRGADVDGDPNDPNPLDYAVNYVIMGNGFGYFTEKPNFGLPGGGQQDWRAGIYGGDSWKINHKLTVNFGVRWDRDTGRTDSDLSPIPCSDAVSVFGSASPCTSGNLFDSLVPGLGAPVRQPNTNFAPQGGFAYDPTGSGKTVIRGGVGIFYENSIFNNTLWDRPGKLKTGLFFAEGLICGPYGTTFSVPGQAPITGFDNIPFTTLCSEPISQSGPEFIKLQQFYQQATASAGAAVNPGYIPYNLTDNFGDIIYAPNYQSPRAAQLNLGVQRQLWQGGVLSVDYLRNVITHIAQNIDVNHVGAARTLNTTAAQNAIAATLAQFDAADIDEAIADGATIADFANNGLDSGNTYLSGGYPASAFGLTPDTGAAFPGMNPAWGNMQVFYPIGRSVYNGLQMNYRQQLKSGSLPGVTQGNLEVSYAFSRFVSTAGADQFFSPGIYDQDCPTCYIGPSGLDRTHQFSAGGFFTVKHGPLLSFITHVYSSLPTNLNLEGDPNGSAGEIFRTDVTGDGTTADLVPGTMPGAFMRQVKANNINHLIARYNQTSANRLTPAGQTLVDNGLFTDAQMHALGAATPTIATAPVNQVNNAWLRSFDSTFAYPIKLRWLGERGSIEPSFSAFNMFNFAYYSNVGGTLESVSSLGQSAAGTAPQSANTTAGFTDRNSLRVADGSGTFQQGAPRELEFSLKLTF